MFLSFAQLEMGSYFLVQCNRNNCSSGNTFLKVGIFAPSINPFLHAINLQQATLKTIGQNMKTVKNENTIIELSCGKKGEIVFYFQNSSAACTFLLMGKEIISCFQMSSAVYASVNGKGDKFLFSNLFNS